MFRSFQIAIAAALGAVLPLANVAAQSAQPPSKSALAARVDSMARAYMAEKGPASMSVAITRGSDTLMLGAWGLADVAANRKATAASTYKIGSVSKQFTAVLVLKQIERGKLALTDSIGQYLTSGLRPEWRPLTIEQLLNHTSGLQNDLEREGPVGDAVPTETMIAWAARDTMRFAPGTRMAYSNVGYVLLGALVEKLYGKPVGAALREEIALPLGLRSLRWCAELGEDSMATTGYSYDAPHELRPFPYAHASKSLGAGGLCATAGDLAAWNRALHGGRVLSPASYTAMITPRGVARGYGFGLQLTTTAWAAPAIYHLGATTGFSAQNAWFPADSLSMTVLFNSLGPSNGFPTNFILDLARAVSAPAQPATGSPAPQPAVADTPATGILGAEALRQFVGEYALERTVFKVDSVKGALVLTTSSGIESPLVHQSGATYAVPELGPGTAITFLADAQGRVVGFLARYDGAPDRRLQKIR